MMKTFTFAVLHFGVAFSVTYLLTGSISISSGVALIEPLVNTVAFYFHEKAWKCFESKNKFSATYRSCTHIPPFHAWNK